MSCSHQKPIQYSIQEEHAYTSRVREVRCFLRIVVSLNPNEATLIVGEDIRSQSKACRCENACSCLSRCRILSVVNGIVREKRGEKYHRSQERCGLRLGKERAQKEAPIFMWIDCCVSIKQANMSVNIQHVHAYNSQTENFKVDENEKLVAVLEHRRRGH